MIIVVGIPGVGKSTVLKPFDGVVNLGDIMLQIARERGFSGSRDELKTLPLEQYKTIHRLAAKRISCMHCKILDTHAALLWGDVVYPGLPYEILKMFNPKMIVIIEAPPEEIAKRRQKDVTRRRTLDIEKIKEELFWARTFAATYASLMGIPIKIIQNINVEDARKALEELI